MSGAVASTLAARPAYFERNCLIQGMTTIKTNSETKRQTILVTGTYSGVNK